jgi:cell division cycle 14
LRSKLTLIEQKFLKKGFNHKDLVFTDGTAPPDHIVKEFMVIADNPDEVLAVHCKAGLGRTGSLIALYAMKHYGFPAAAFIGWI